MPSERVRIERAGCIVHLVLNRPEMRNALDSATTAELTAKLRDAERDPAVRIIELSAAGHCFCAGADLREMSGGPDIKNDAALKDAQSFVELLGVLSALKKPTIARIQGAAVGGGVGLVACCDIAVASERAYFRLSEVQLGLVPAMVGPYLVEALGVRTARRLMLTSERFDASQAAEWGLVHRVVPHLDLAEACDAFARNLLRGAPGAQAACKELTREIAAGPIDDALQNRTAEVMVMRRRSDEARQGLLAFRRKSRPPWAVPTNGDTSCSR